jgi:hypothetical protein
MIQGTSRTSAFKNFKTFDQVIGLISVCKKETIAEIEHHIESKDLVEYLSQKYAKHFYVSYDGDSPYDIAALNFSFSTSSDIS